MTQLTHRPTAALEAKTSLADDFDALYKTALARVDETDLEHIRNVAAYSKAIDARGQELIMRGGSPGALRRGVMLRALHVVLEFSELGHNVLHGSYDAFDDPEFHSERFDWAFLADPAQWRTMHHRNHHPFTNIVGKDHDIGYSVARLLSGQSWYAHHSAQLAILLLFIVQLYPSAIYTASSAARTEGKAQLTREALGPALRLIAEHIKENYLRQPLAAGPRALHTILGNYLGTILGHDLTFAMLLVEHHAPEVELFADPGPSETRDAYYERQIRGTMNFTPDPQLEASLVRLLAEEVDFPNPPNIHVFYGGLETHLEHHLFPDLPCSRQREVVPEVQAICEAHGLPYNRRSMRELVPEFVSNLLTNAVPIGEGEAPVSLLRRPRALYRRIRDGLRYRTPNAAPYLAAPSYYNAPARVLRAEPSAGGEAISLEMGKPRGWEDITWDAGAFISLRVEVPRADGGSEVLVRQYSLTSASEDSPDETFNITVKRVAGGRVSNHLADHVSPGQWVTLVTPPQNHGGLIVSKVPDKALYLAGGVGITPILSMLRKQARVAPHHEATLLYFNRSDQSTLFQDELAHLATRMNLTVLRFVDGPENAPHCARLSQGLLHAHVPDLPEREVFACAPPGFLTAAQTHLAALGLPEGQFHVESFTAPPVERIPPTGRTHRVRFTRSGVNVDVDEATTLLEAARGAGLELPSGCERGLCRACVCPKRTGTTLMGDALDDDAGRITLCNSFPRSALELDA